MYKKEENVNLNLLNEDIKNKNVKPLYYFYGEETYLLRRYLHSIKKILNDENIPVTEFDSENYTDNVFFDTINESTFFSPKKFIILYNLKYISKNYQIGILKSIIDNLDNNYIIFIDYETENKYEYKYNFKKLDNLDSIRDEKNKELNKTEKKDYLLNVINTYGRIVNFKKLDKTEVKKYINSYLKKNNKTMDNFLLDLFLEETGLELSTIFSEIDKLIAYTGDREDIKKEDVDIVVSRVVNDEIFSFIDNINLNNKEIAFKLYSDLIMKNVPYRKIFYLIKDNYMMLLKVKSKMNGEGTVSSIARELKLPDWRVEKCMRVLSSMDEDFIIDKLNKINDIDYDFMNGNIRENFLVELFI